MATIVDFYSHIPLKALQLKGYEILILKLFECLKTQNHIWKDFQELNHSDFSLLMNDFAEKSDFRTTKKLAQTH